MFRSAVSTLALMAAMPASAQDAAGDQPITVSEAAALRAELAALRKEVAALKADKTKIEAAVPSWKGAPQFSDSAAGFSFKPKGQIQVDGGFVSNPGATGGIVGPVTAAFGAAGVNTNNLGFNTRLRRVNVGAEGALPGGFGYSFEFELSQGSVGYEDIVLTYQRKGSPLQLRIGHQYPLSSLEIMTSSKFTSFLERAGSSDVFGFGRRLGLTLSYAKDDVTLAGGLYSEDGSTTNFARTGWQASGRGTWSPKFGDVQAHLGFNVQHRVQPRDAQNVRYRMRPFTQITDQRFLDTGRIAADGDDILGVELGGTFKALHFAAEAQKLWVRGYQNPVLAFGANNGTGGASAFLVGDPSFFSGYVEAGYFLTGETRGYKGGRWDRTKVLHPFDKGGWGALQINARIDHSDVQDKVGGGAITPGSLNFASGGKQTGYEASLIWLPSDYLKFLAQFVHLAVTGGPAAVAAFTSVTPAFQDRRYSSDVMTVRAQIDF